MNTRKGVVAVALGVSLAAAPLGAAQAEDGRQVASTGHSAIVTKGYPGPKFKKGKVFKKSPKRNGESYAGARPYWVQLPVIVKAKGKYRIDASVSARAFKRPGVHGKSVADQIVLTVAVLKKGKTTPTKENTTVREIARVKVAKNGLVRLSAPISNKAVKRIRALPKKNDRLYVTLAHAKDTYPEAGKDRDLQQVVVGAITNKVITKKMQRKAIARNVAGQRVRENDKARKRVGARLSNLNQAYYEGLWLQNNSPFTQGITVTPNIQCMVVPDVTDNYVDGATPTTISNPNGPFNFTVPANSGGVSLFYNNDPNPIPQSDDQWYGANQGNPTGTPPPDMQALANAGREVLNELPDALMDPETYTGKGLLTTGIGAALTFGVALIVDLVEANNECSDYGQFWGLSSTALYVGLPSSPNSVYGTPQSWATAFFETTGYGGTTAEIGQPSNQPNSLPAAGSSDWNAMEAMLNAAVGQQSNSTYFHGAGMPGPYANAQGNTQWNGVTSFSQGLLHYLYPNPGSCQNNNCNNVGTAIQFGYLMDGYDGPIGPQLENLPTASVSTGTNANTGQAVTELNCAVPNDGTFVNPFTGSQGQPGPASAPELNSLSGMQGVSAAQFVVSYYAQDANGNYLYNSGTTSTSGYPGPLAGNQAYGAAAYPPTLQASENSVQLLSMNQAQNATQLDLSASDLSSLINPSTGAAATATQFGCVVIPMVTWQNMSVTSGSVWGGNWPFPQTSAGGPLSSPYNNYFNWMSAVDAINLAWTGDPYISAPVPAP